MITQTESHIDKLMSQATLSLARAGQKTFVATATLPNGFEIVVSSSAMDPEKFSYAVGEKICREKIREKLFELEAYSAHSQQLMLDRLQHACNILESIKESSPEYSESIDQSLKYISVALPQEQN